VRFDGAFDQGPFIPPGAVIADTDRVVEFQDVLAELSELFEAIDPDDLAVVINDGLGAFDDRGPQIARAIDQGSRATDVAVRNLDDQVIATRDLSLVAETLAPLGDEFNALGSETLRGLPVLSDNQVQTRRVLTTLSRFSRELDATLEVDRQDFDRMVVAGDSVTRMLFVYADEVGEVIAGLNNYTSQYAKPGFQSDTTQGQAAYFEIFIDSGIQSELCPQLPPELSDNLPLCTGRDPVDPPGTRARPSPSQRAQAPSRAPLAAVEVPHQMLQPEQPQRIDLRALLELRAAIGEMPDGR
jgi:ABC-type transporter Mla subunit MlaD